MNRCEKEREKETDRQAKIVWVRERKRESQKELEG